jgi:hypothetical protein
MIKPKEAHDLDHLLLEKIDAQIHAVETAAVVVNGVCVALVKTGAMTAFAAERKRVALAIAVTTLRMLKHPSVNTAVASLMRLELTMQALVADVALTLAEGGPGQQNLANRLRSLIEGRS